MYFQAKISILSPNLTSSFAFMFSNKVFLLEPDMLFNSDCHVVL